MSNLLKNVFRRQVKFFADIGPWPAYSLVSVLKADFSLLEADCTLLPHICDHIDRQSPTFSPITKGLF